MSDDTWFTDIHCPQSFDFESIISVPATNNSHNPPLQRSGLVDENPSLLDSAWDSDDDTRKFFKSLKAELANRHPTRPQKNKAFATDIRTLGPPRYKNRPTIPFEEYVRLHERSPTTPDSSSRSAPSHEQKLMHSPGKIRAKSADSSTLPDPLATTPNRPHSNSRRPLSSVLNTGLWRPPVRKTSHNDAQGTSLSYPAKSSAGIASSPNALKPEMESVVTVSSSFFPLSVSSTSMVATDSNDPCPETQRSKPSPPCNIIEFAPKPAVAPTRIPRRAQDKENQIPEPSTLSSAHEKMLVCTTSESATNQASNTAQKPCKSSASPDDDIKDSSGFDPVSRKRNFSQQRCKSFNGVDSSKNMQKSDNLESSSRIQQKKSCRAKSEYRKTVSQASSRETKPTTCPSETEDLSTLLEARNALVLQQRMKSKTERQKSLDRLKEQALQTFLRKESKLMTKTPSTKKIEPEPKLPAQHAIVAARQRVASKNSAKLQEKDNNLTKRNHAVQKSLRKVLTGVRSRSHTTLPFTSSKGTTSEHGDVKNDSGSSSPEQSADLQSALHEHNQSVTGRRHVRVATDG